MRTQRIKDDAKSRKTLKNQMRIHRINTDANSS